jgi:hypothetical protein
MAAMRRVLAVMLAFGCQHPAPPPMPEPPQCVPTLETTIVQLKDVSEPVPEGLSESAAFEAMVELLTSSGIPIDTVDRAAHTIVTKPFAGETLEWTCDMFEYREYAYRVAVAGNRWVVGLDCHRSYGWEAHMSGDKVVPADHGVLTECLESAKYTTRLDAMRSKNIVIGARKLAQEHRGPIADPR